MGGGSNHRIGLFDMVMIKDNHVTAAGGVVPAIQHAQVGPSLITLFAKALVAFTCTRLPFAVIIINLHGGLSNVIESLKSQVNVLVFSSPDL